MNHNGAKIDGQKILEVLIDRLTWTFCNRNSKGPISNLAANLAYFDPFQTLLLLKSMCSYGCNTITLATWDRQKDRKSLTCRLTDGTEKLTNRQTQSATIIDNIG